MPWAFGLRGCNFAVHYVAQSQLSRRINLSLFERVPGLALAGILTRVTLVVHS